MKSKKNKNKMSLNVGNEEEKKVDTVEEQIELPKEKKEEAPVKEEKHDDVPAVDVDKKESTEEKKETIQEEVINDKKEKKKKKKQEKKLQSMKENENNNSSNNDNNGKNASNENVDKKVEEEIPVNEEKVEESKVDESKNVSVEEVKEELVKEEPVKEEIKTTEPAKEEVKTEAHDEVKKEETPVPTGTMPASNVQSTPAPTVIPVNTVNAAPQPSRTVVVTTGARTINTGSMNGGSTSQPTTMPNQTMMNGQNRMPSQTTFNASASRIQTVNPQSYGIQSLDQRLAERERMYANQQKKTTAKDVLSYLLMVLAIIACIIILSILAGFGPDKWFQKKTTTTVTRAYTYSVTTSQEIKVVTVQTTTVAQKATHMAFDDQGVKTTKPTSRAAEGTTGPTTIIYHCPGDKVRDGDYCHCPAGTTEGENDTCI